MQTTADRMAAAKRTQSHSRSNSHSGSRSRSLSRSASKRSFSRSPSGTRSPESMTGSRSASGSRSHSRSASGSRSASRSRSGSRTQSETEEADRKRSKSKSVSKSPLPIATLSESKRKDAHESESRKEAAEVRRVKEAEQRKKAFGAYDGRSKSRSGSRSYSRYGSHSLSRSRRGRHLSRSPRRDRSRSRRRSLSGRRPFERADTTSSSGVAASSSGERFSRRGRGRDRRDSRRWRYENKAATDESYAEALRGAHAPTYNIFVKNIPTGTSEEELKRVFSVFGEIFSTKIVRPARRRQFSDDYGFVNFATSESQRDALEATKRGRVKIGAEVLRCEESDGSTVVYLNGIPAGASRSDLRYFVRKSVGPYNAINFLSTYAYIVYPSFYAAEKAIHLLNGARFQGAQLSATVASESKARRSEMVHETANERTIFAARVPPNMGVDDLRNTFAQFGEITSVRLAGGNSKGRGYAFVEFANSGDAEIAFREAQGADVKGHKLTLDWCREAMGGGSSSGKPSRGRRHSSGRGNSSVVDDGYSTRRRSSRRQSHARYDRGSVGGLYAGAGMHATGGGAPQMMYPPVMDPKLLHSLPVMQMPGNPDFVRVMPYGAYMAAAQPWMHESHFHSHSARDRVSRRRRRSYSRSPSRSRSRRRRFDR